MELSRCVQSGYPMNECADQIQGDGQARGMADAVARRSYGKLVALLATRTGDLAAAEDALSEAFLKALETWPRDGCPSNPEAWLLAVARRKNIDVARRRRREELATDQLDLLAQGSDAAAADAVIPDHRLALMFACASGYRDRHSRAVDFATAAGSERGQDRLGVPCVSGDHGSATRSRQEQDQALWRSASNP